MFGDHTAIIANWWRMAFVNPFLRYLQQCKSSIGVRKVSGKPRNSVVRVTDLTQTDQKNVEGPEKLQSNSKLLVNSTEHGLILNIKKVIIKGSFMLDLTKHEIYPAQKCLNANGGWHFSI